MVFILFGAKRTSNNDYTHLKNEEDIVPVRTLVKIPCQPQKIDYLTAVISTDNRSYELEQMPVRFIDINEQKGSANFVTFRLNKPMPRDELHEFIKDNHLMSSDKVGEFVADLGKSKLIPPFITPFSFRH